MDDSIIEILQKDNDWLASELSKAARKIVELKQQKFAYFESDECWIYQGDGNDHLESLTCPVVISAEDLMELKRKAEVSSMLVQFMKKRHI